uniref:Uncharacterized protein n=1 Tax=Ditylenchus dipsaci TaxID=166011 RepID=A0A915DSW5_9BILA
MQANNNINFNALDEALGMDANALMEFMRNAVNLAQAPNVPVMLPRQLDGESTLHQTGSGVAEFNQSYL